MTKKPANRIEVRFSAGRRLKLLSYAVYLNGNCTVSHATTRESRKAGCNLQNMISIEQAWNPALRIQ
jgi:hypothetical protein